MFKRTVIFFCSFILFFNATSNNENFIISKNAKTKRISKNTLKKDIGAQARDTLNYCAELNKQIGVLQIELSKIQQRLFKTIESLIDNRAPFKKANKPNLKEASNILNHVKVSLNNQLKIIESLKVQMNKNICLKEDTA